MNTNKVGQTQEKFEVRLGLIQLVMLFGVVTGVMVCSFGLGFFSGRSVGLEAAQETMIASAARFPISEQLGDSDLEIEHHDVYAKLSDPPALEELAEKKEEPVKGKEGTSAADAPDAVNEIAERLVQQTPPAVEQAPAEVAEEPAAAEEEDSALTLSQVREAQGGAAKENSKPAIPQINTPTLGEVGAVQKEAEKKEEAKAPVIKSVSDAKKEVAETKVQPPVEMKVQTPVETKLAKVAPPQATPAQKATPPSKQASTPSLKGRGWYAQVAAPKERKEADALAAKLRSSGFTPAIEETKIKGQQYYRVVVGPEGSRDQAELLKGQLKREKYIEGEPFVRMVK